MNDNLQDIKKLAGLPVTERITESRNRVTLRKSFSAYLAEEDMNGSHCSCGGTYEQTDEGVFDGVLHCNICGETTKRYGPDAESPGADSTSSSTVITNTRDAAPVTDMLRMFCSAHKNVSFQSHHSGNSVTFVITGPNPLVRKIRISINNTIMENKG